MNTPIFLKTYFSFLLSTLAFFKTYSQDIQFEKSFGGKQDEFLFEVLPTPDYGFILGGSSLSSKSGNKEGEALGDLDFWIWKMNEKGQAEFQKSYGGEGADLLQGIQLTSDGGMVLSGTTTSRTNHKDQKATKKGDIQNPIEEEKKAEGFGQEDILIIKLDAKGTELWSKRLGGEGQEKITTCLPTPDGGYLVAGSSASKVSGNKASTNYGNLDFWVVKLDKDGVIEWENTYGGAFVEILRSVVITKDGYVLGGSSNSLQTGNKTAKGHDNFDFWLVKIDLLGSIRWDIAYDGGASEDVLAVVIPTKDNQYYLAGTKSTSSTSADVWLLKIDNLGTTLWEKAFDFTSQDVVSSLLENPNGSLIIGATIAGKGTKNTTNKSIPSAPNNDYLVAKISASGELLWDKKVGSKGNDILRKAIATRDGGYLLAGHSTGEASNDKSSAKGGEDFWVVKLKDNDKPEAPRTNIETLPNPAVSFTNVIINLDYSEGTVTLYDLNGRVISQTPVKGERTVPVNLSNLPTGIYVIDVKTNNGQEGIKVIKK